MTEHIGRQPFVNLGHSGLVKPLEVRRAELRVQDDDGSVRVGPGVPVVPAEQIRLRPARETGEMSGEARCHATATASSWIGGAWRSRSHLLGAVSSSAARASASHVFAPCTLKKAEQPGGGDSLDAISEKKKKKDARVNHGYKTKQNKKQNTHNVNMSVSGLRYLLEGVHRGRVGSKGEGELQHVHLDGAEQGAGSLHDQLIVGLICVCSGTRSRGGVSGAPRFHSSHLRTYLPFRISNTATAVFYGQF